MKKLLLILLLLFITSCVWANTSIYCPYCLRKLYEYTEEVKDSGSFNPKFFRTVDLAAIPPELVNKLEDFKCPYDGAPLNGYLYWAWEGHYDAPKLVYKALTVYTKDKDGTFIWYPDVVNLR